MKSGSHNLYTDTAGRIVKLQHSGPKYVKNTAEHGDGRTQTW